MSALDDLHTQAAEQSVSGWVVNIIVVLAWLPPLMILFGIAIAILGIGYRTARYGTLPELTGLSGALSSEITLLAIGVSILGFYWLLSVATFGGDTVETATETADNAAQTLDDHTDD